MNAKHFMLRISTSALLALLLARCGGGGGDGSSATSENLVDRCSGTYLCSLGDETTTATMSRFDGACFLGRFILEPDGSALMGDETYSWSGDATSFQICASDGCFVCTSTASSGS